MEAAGRVEEGRGLVTMYHVVIHRGSVGRHRHRQERWLHTRISETLEDALKREARRRRLPVSLFVRHVLEGALDLVEDIVETSLGARPRAEREAPPRGRDGGVDDVYGWQELVLARAADCARCDAALAAGTHAHRGLRESAGPPVFLCAACLGRLRPPSDRKEETT